MDDQRGVLPTDYDLPDFLKTKSLSSDPNASIRSGQQPTTTTKVFEDDYKCVVSVLSDKLSSTTGSSSDKLDLSGFIPHPDRADRYFGHSNSSDSASGDQLDFNDSKVLSGRDLSLGYHNISLISVGNESGRSSALSSHQSFTPDSPVFPSILLSSEPDLATADGTDSGSNAKRRGPPPPYPGRTPESVGSRSRKGIVDVKSGENWNVDYV